MLLFILIALTGCGRSAPHTPSVGKPESNPDAPFRNVASEWSIEFKDQPRNAASYHLPALMGSGCAVLDFDRNGHLDLLFLAHDSLNRNVAFFSQEVEGTFTERSEKLGLQSLSGAGVAVGDANNDGWPDLYIASYGPDTLWLNESGHGFRNVTDNCGISNARWGTSACWLDFDRDGWLDLFVTNYVDYEDRACTRLGGGDPDFCTPGLFNRTADVLFRNVTGESPDGALSFVDVSNSTGISNGLSAGLGVTAMDFNGDNWIDIYVASDQHPNLLWINQQGQFTDEATIRGCDLDFQGRAQASMGIALGDFSGDGIEDLVLSHLDGESHAVYRRDAAGYCRDICRETGFATATRTSTGFGVCAVDFDFDGICEVLTVNGRVQRPGKRPLAPADFWKPYQQPCQLLKTDRRDGPWKAYDVLGGEPHLARGLAIGDLDRDGDPDAVVSTVGESVIVLRNDFVSARPGLAVRIVDPKLSGRSCPGAKISLDTDDGPLEHTFQPCQSSMSSHADELFLAMPSGSATLTLSVIWPHGDMRPERFSFARGNDAPIVIERGEGIVE